MKKNATNTHVSKNINLASKTGNSATQLIVNKITIAPVRRGVLDVQKWRDALRYAESTIGRRAALYDLYDDVLLDTHLTAEIEKREMAITNSEIVFINSKGEVVDELSDLIDTPTFEEVLIEIIKTKFWGITLIEFESGIKQFLPHSIERKHIRPIEGIVINDQNDDDGIHYREGTYPNWTIEIGKPKDLGLLLKAAFWVIIKRGGIGDFAQFSELFGMPTRIGEYDVFDEATRIELEKCLKEAGSAGYILKPKGTDITLLENTSNTDGGIFSNLISICDKAISTFILGQTLTTIDKSGSGQAQGKIHQETKDEIIKADKRYVQRILNSSVIRILENLGYPVKDGKFTFRDDVPIEQRLAKMKLFEAMKKNNVPVEDDYVYEQVGVPKPENYEALKKELAAKAKPVPTTEPPAAPTPEEKPVTKPIKKTKDKSLKWSDRMVTLLNELKSFFV